ncbi:hypothetical protein KJ039_09140 [bacterium]|nr:hypothetical protein [bacterium]
MKSELNQIDKKKYKMNIKQLLEPKPGMVNKAKRFLKEIIAISFWIYVFVKLFVFDLDVFLVNRFAPEYIWLTNLKFFIILAVLAIIWLVSKNKNIFFWSMYIIFYPAILFFWKFPFFIFKQKSWSFAFASINALISFFISIKYNFIIIATFIISLAIIFYFSNVIIIWCAIFALSMLLFVIYVHRLLLIFKPAAIFQLYSKIFSAMREHAQSSFVLDENMKAQPIEKLDQKQLEKWTANLQTAVLFNRICLFVAKKLKNYQNSGLNIISYVLTLLLLVIFTTISFTFINYGLYKINNNFFDISISNTPSLFIFFYYSFNNLLFNSIQEIQPIVPITQTVFMLESFFALFLIVIFVSLLLTVKSKRHSDELDKTIGKINEEGNSLEKLIAAEYNLDIESAIRELDRLKAGLVAFIYKLSKNIQ